MEKFIERGTDFKLRNGLLSIYETNCSCKDVKFYFDQYVFTLMRSGHKTIVSENLKFEFFPGTFFIPEKETINNISIPNASVYNPTQCLVLELEPSYVQAVYEELLFSDTDKDLLYNSEPEESSSYFLSNDRLLIQSFTRLYDLQTKDRSVCKSAVEDLVIREMLYRIFSTEGLYLLMENFEKSVEDEGIRKVVAHISSHIDQKLTVETLSKVAGMGKTTFFKIFKECIGQTPTEYILNQRIKHAKVLIQKNRYTLQEIAYRCGFNSYEYFCNSFRKIDGNKPTAYKRSQQGSR